MKKRTSFPPGPYSYHRDRNGCDEVWLIEAPGIPLPLVEVPFWDEPGTREWVERSEAIARLFTAAPDLLHALELADALLTATARDYAGSDTSRLARAAIANAEGLEFREQSHDTRFGIPDFNHIRYDMLILPPEIEGALGNIVDHYWSDEKHDFDGLPKEERNRHVAKDLHKLRVWLHCPTGYRRARRSTGQ